MVGITQSATRKFLDMVCDDGKDAIRIHLDVEDHIKHEHFQYKSDNRSVVEEDVYYRTRVYFKYVLYSRTL